VAERHSDDETSSPLRRKLSRGSESVSEGRDRGRRLTGWTHSDGLEGIDDREVGVEFGFLDLVILELVRQQVFPGQDARHLGGVSWCGLV
jgi:hypothetical protein